MSMKMILAAVAIATAGGAYCTTYYVDNTQGKESYDGKAAVWDGTHGPKLLIQSAVDLADDGDTVSVAAGTYGADQGCFARDTSRHAHRILIGKNITLAAPAGRDKTIIEGALGTNASLQNKNSVAGIVIEATAPNAKISGFTFRNCTTSQTSGSANVNGSAVLFEGDYGGLSGQPWVTDCAVDFSVSYRGALAKVNVARSIIKGCRTYYNFGFTVGFQCNFAHCIFDGCSDYDDTHWFTSPLIYKGDYVLNCTFVHNCGTISASNPNAPTYFSNSLVCDNYGSLNVNAAVDVQNSVFEEDLWGYIVPHTNAVKIAKKYELASPSEGDYRPVACVAGISDSVVAATYGLESRLSVLPEEYRYKDCYGTAFSATDGKIAAGAVQTVMTPIAGFSATNIMVNATSPFAPLCKRAGRLTFYLEEFPKAYTLSNFNANPADILFYNASDLTPAPLIADDSGEAIYVPAKGAFVAGITAYAPTETWYVRKNGSNETGDGSDEKPFATIQKAVDAITDTADTYAFVKVGDGTYDTDGAVSTLYPDKDTIINRIAVNKSNAAVSIRSENGPEKTFIVGKAGSGANGLGTDAERIVKFKGTNQGVRGFTLVGGYTSDTGSFQDCAGGAACGKSGRRCTVTDCVISNCVGYNVAAVYNCYMLRCTVVSNYTSYGTILSATVNANCVFANNKSKNPVLDSDVSCANCSFYEPWSMAMPSKHSYFANCIVGKANNTSANSGQLLLAGCVFENFTYNYTSGSNREGTDYVYGKAAFVDAANGDLHVATGSDGFDNAVNAWNGASANWTDALLYAYYYSTIASDMDGNSPMFINGRPTIGAYYKPSKQTVTLSADPALSIESTAANGMADFGEEVTVTAAVAGNRPLAGLEVNGELKEGITSWKFTPSAGEFTAEYAVKAVSPSPMIWYVKPDGDDTATGWSEAAAMGTLEGVMGKTLAGDMVCALPGVYETGSMLQNAQLSHTPVLRSRVVVPVGVTLYSRDGAETTVIRGERAAGSTGIGEGAMRCAFVQTNAVLRGFTLTGGATRMLSYGNNIDNDRGGGVLAAENTKTLTGAATSRIVDCFVTNCSAAVGGAGANGNWERCRLIGNLGTIGSGALAQPYAMYGCIVDYSRGTEAVADPREMEGCTLGAHNTTTDLKTAPSVVCDPGASTWTVKNSLFLGGGASRIRYAYNCAMPETMTLTSSQSTTVRENIFNGDVSCDSDYRPLRSNVAVDNGDYSLRTTSEPELDGLGGQRIYNGTMDIGALEMDWRGIYAKDIAEHAFAVGSASPEVVENANGRVAVADGASLTATWKGAGDGRNIGYSLVLKTAEGAVANVEVNGTAYEFAEAGEHKLQFSSAVALNELNITSAGGITEVYGGERAIGFALIIR